MKPVNSEFESRQTPQRMEVAAKWMASDLENRSTAEDVVGVRFLQLPLTINNQSITTLSLLYSIQTEPNIIKYSFLY